MLLINAENDIWLDKTPMSCLDLVMICMRFVVPKRHQIRFSVVHTVHTGDTSSPTPVHSTLGIVTPAEVGSS